MSCCCCIPKLFSYTSSDDALTNTEDQTLAFSRDSRIPSLAKTAFDASPQDGNSPQFLVMKMEERNGVLYCSNGTVPKITTSARKVCLTCNFKVEGAIIFVDKKGTPFKGEVSICLSGCQLGDEQETRKNAKVSFYEDTEEEDECQILQ